MVNSDVCYTQIEHMADIIIFLVNISLLPAHDHIEIFLQDGWRDGLCKCKQVNKTISV
jgi:hypothetical protein